jgi:hypothetical protein
LEEQQATIVSFLISPSSSFSSPLCAAQGISVASLGNPDKDGYLTKRGGNIKTWKKRWCVLKDGSIFYFKGPKVGSNTQAPRPAARGGASVKF